MYLSLLRLILAALICSSDSSSYWTVLTFFITSAEQYLQLSVLLPLLRCCSSKIRCSAALAAFQQLLKAHCHKMGRYWSCYAPR